MFGKQTYRTKAKIVHGQGFTTVLFQHPFRFGRALMMVGFLAIWIFGGIFALAMLSVSHSEETWFFYIWLPLWFCGGLFVIWVAIWSTFGRQALVARSDSLALTTRLFGLPFGRSWPAAAIDRMQWLHDDPTHTLRVNDRRIPVSALTFVVGDRTVYCARGIGRDDADAAIKAVLGRLVVNRRRRAG